MTEKEAKHLMKLCKEKGIDGHCAVTPLDEGWLFSFAGDHMFDNYCSAYTFIGKVE